MPFIRQQSVEIGTAPRRATPGSGVPQAGNGAA